MEKALENETSEWYYTLKLCQIMIERHFPIPKYSFLHQDSFLLPTESTRAELLQTYILSPIFHPVQTHGN